MRWAVRLTKPVLMLVAFMLSMVLYLYVQSQTAPVGAEKGLSIVVHSKGLASGLIFDEEGGTVLYDATGPRDKLDRLVTGLKDNPELITAVTNLSSISSASVHDKVHVDNVRLLLKAPDFPGIDFVQSQTLNGVVERKKTREVRVKVEFPSATTPGAWAEFDRDSFEVIPDTITLTGPSSEIDNAALTAVVNPEEAEQNGGVRVRLSVPHNLVSTPRVDFVEVHPSRHERQAYVNVLFSGHLPAGFKVSNYYVKTATGGASTTAIRGPSGIVDKTSAIEAAVDISGLKKGFTFTAVPRMPRQLELVDAPLQIRVDIEKTRQ